MNKLAEHQSYFNECGDRFVLHYLKQGQELVKGIQNPEARKYITHLQEIFQNIHSALLKGITTIKKNHTRESLWKTWRETVVVVFVFYDYRGYWDQMRSILSEGIQEAISRRDSFAEAHFIFLFAVLDSHQGLVDEALAKSEQVLELFTSLQDEVSTSSVLHFRGTLLRRHQLMSEARNSFELSLAISERLGNKAGQASTLYEIGRLEEMQEDFKVAERLYQTALLMFQELGAPRETATLLFQLGALLVDNERLEYALHIYKDLMDERGYAQALHQLGNVWNKRGDKPKAQAYYIEAVQIFERLGAHNSVQAVQRDRLKFEVS